MDNPPVVVSSVMTQSFRIQTQVYDHWLASQKVILFLKLSLAEILKASSLRYNFRPVMRMPAWSLLHNLPTALIGTTWWSLLDSTRPNREGLRPSQRLLSM